MTPRDAWRCAGWAARLAAWALLTQHGVSEASATRRTGVRPVRGHWRRDAARLAFDDGPSLRVVVVAEWVVAGAVVFAAGDGCVWVLSTESEGR